MTVVIALSVLAVVAISLAIISVVFVYLLLLSDELSKLSDSDFDIFGDEDDLP